MRQWLTSLRRQPLELHPLHAYARWAEAYPPHAHNPLMRAEEAAVLELLPEAAGKVALDLACGTGRYARHLRARGSRRVVAADFSLEMLRAGRDDNLPLVCADWLALPIPDGFFDLVVSGLAAGHIEDLAGALRELARVLKPGGVVVYSDFDPIGYFMGWRRTFTDVNGRTLAIRHYPHLFSDHFAAAEAAGLRIDAVREPCAVDEYGRRAWGEMPAALVIRAMKLGDGVSPSHPD